MSFSQESLCNLCKGKGAKPRYYQSQPGTQASGHYLCDECFTKLIRNLSGRTGVKSIQDELKELKTMQMYLLSRSLSFEIPYQAIFEWIVNEQWSELTSYVESIKPEVKKALDQQWNEHVAELEKVPDKFISDVKIYDERKRIVKNRKKWWETNFKTNDALLLLERTKDMIERDGDLLATLHYFEERSAFSDDQNHTDVWASIEGLSIFISGRSTGLEEERNAVADFLKKYGAVVTRFELVSSNKQPFLQCREWARDCEIYIGIFGSSYGDAQENGLSATEIEFNAAKENNRPMIIAVKQGDRDAQQQTFISKIRDWESGLMAPPFRDTQHLLEVVKTSLQHLLTEQFRGK
ncbi:MAG: DUF4062 domain-containing protein [Candidatus Odinarchaeota archaeon]